MLLDPRLRTVASASDRNARGLRSVARTTARGRAQPCCRSHLGSELLARGACARDFDLNFLRRDGANYPAGLAVVKRNRFAAANTIEKFGKRDADASRADDRARRSRNRMRLPALAEVQEEILWICEAAHVPVIRATQVLEYSRRRPLPHAVPPGKEAFDAAQTSRRPRLPCRGLLHATSTEKPEPSYPWDYCKIA